MDDNIRKETALKELKYKIAEVESEFTTQVDAEKELRDNIRKEKEESQKLIKEMEHDANVANEKAMALRRKRDTLVGALKIMEEVKYMGGGYKMLTLDEFFNKLDRGEIQPSTMIVRLRYKYSFETEFIEENELLMYECDRNGAPVFVWENDWDEGQTSDGEVYVMGWIDVDDVKVPEYEPDYEPSVLADGSLNPDGEYGRMR